MRHRTLAVAAVIITLFSPLAAHEVAAAESAPAFFQARLFEPPPPPARLFEPLPLQADVPDPAEPQVVPVSSAQAPSAQTAAAPQLSTSLREQMAPGRSGPSSGGMWALYTATVAMQALDLHSTLNGFKSGAVEANPVMGGITKNRAAFYAVKAAVATGTILAARTIAKRSRLAAVVMLVAVNSAYAVVAVHNYKVAHSLR